MMVILSSTLGMDLRDITVSSGNIHQFLMGMDQFVRGNVTSGNSFARCRNNRSCYIKIVSHGLQSIGYNPAGDKGGCSRIHNSTSKRRANGVGDQGVLASKSRPRSNQ